MSEVSTTQSWTLKYRPRHFGDLIGQDEAVSMMRGMIKRKQPPSSIGFFGPYGCGKTTSARMLGRYLNCKTWDACGKCESCQMPEDHHPDITELNGANTRGIDDVRKLIEKARFMPRFRYRIFILDEIHQWTPNAAEAFLKDLEEPPPRTLHILGSTDPQKMKPTILSRLTTIVINLPKKEEIMERLQHVAKKEKLDFKKEVLEAAAEGSGGHVRDALALLEGAALKYAGNPKMRTKDLVAAIAKSGTMEGAAVATKVLLGMYLGKTKVTAKAVFDITDPIPTMNSALRMNEYVLAHLLFEGQAMPQGVWHTPECRLCASQVAKYAKDVKVSTVLEVQRKLVTARTEMQAFAVPERSLLLSALS